MSEMKFGLGVNPRSAGYETGSNTAYDLVTGKFDVDEYNNALAWIEEITQNLKGVERGSLDHESYSAELSYWRGVVKGMDSQR